jgi:dephospho-CoA kinase
MQIVGLTGNIGSGKSTIAKVFAALGVPVFNSDEEAKKVYSIPSVQIEVQIILETYIDFLSIGWKEQIASIIFNYPDKRIKLESLVHDYVKTRFIEWIAQQKSPYVIREAALSQSFNEQNCDWLIEVTADKITRLKRVIKRSGYTSEEFEKRDALQKYNSTFPYNRRIVISNDVNDKVLPTILQIHENFCA